MDIINTNVFQELVNTINWNSTINEMYLLSGEIECCIACTEAEREKSVRDVWSMAHNDREILFLNKMYTGLFIE